MSFSAKCVDPGNVVLYKSRNVPLFNKYDAAVMHGMAVNTFGQTFQMLDTFVGNGTLASVAQCMFYDHISHIYGVDISPERVKATEKNMDLLSNVHALDARVQDLLNAEVIDSEALDQVALLKKKVCDRNPIPYTLIEGDILHSDLKIVPKDAVVITDPPYSNETKEDMEENFSFLADYMEKMLNHNFEKFILATQKRKGVEDVLKKYVKITESTRRRARKIFACHVL